MSQERVEGLNRDYGAVTKLMDLHGGLAEEAKAI